MKEKVSAQLTAEEIVQMPTFYHNGRSVLDVVRSIVDDGNRIGWRYVRKNRNNKADVEISSGLIEALVELITNSNDAYAIQHLDDVDSLGGLIESVADDEVDIAFTGGDTGRGSDGEFSVTVGDVGCGVDQDEVEDAFVRDPANGGVDKTEHDLLYGEFAQGSLGSIGISKHGCKLIISASKDNPMSWAWTIVRRDSDGNYRYLTVNGDIPKFSGVFDAGPLGEMEYGTVTKVFDVDTQTPDTVTGGRFLRQLGHKFPFMNVPAKLQDLRGGQVEERDWRGMMPELYNLDDITHLEMSGEVSDLGSVTIHAFVSDNGFSTEFADTNTNKRMFFTVYGMTHHKETYVTLENDCGLQGINEDMFLFVECSDLDVRVNDIFMPDRTRMKETDQADTFFSSICSCIRDWDELQAIDEERTDITDKVGDGNNSPIKTLEFDSGKNPEVELKNGEATVSLSCNCSIDGYLERDHINFKVNGSVNNSVVSVNGNSVSVSVQDVSGGTGVLNVIDDAFDQSIQKVFNTCIPSDLESDAKEFAQIASETAEDTMISRYDYIPQEDLDAEIRKKMDHIEYLSSIDYDSTTELEKELADLFVRSDDPEDLGKFLFELLSYPRDKDTYYFHNESWNMCDVADEIRDGNVEKAEFLASIAVDVGIDEIPIGNEFGLRIFYKGLLQGGCSDRRKGIQGGLYEDAVEEELQAAIDKFNEKTGRNLSLDDQHMYYFNNNRGNKKFDHIITDEDGNIVLVFEENCYSTQGSKIGSFARSSDDQVRKCNEDGLTFVRVTDGVGMSENEYKCAYESVFGNMYNLELLKENFYQDLMSFFEADGLQFSASF